MEVPFIDMFCNIDSPGYVGNLLSSLLKGLYTLDGEMRGRGRRRNKGYKGTSGDKGATGSKGGYSVRKARGTESKAESKSSMDHPVDHRGQHIKHDSQDRDRVDRDRRRDGDSAYDGECTRSGLDQLYTLAVCVLIIVSDRAAQRLLPSLSVDAPWYKERAASKVS